MVEKKPERLYYASGQVVMVGPVGSVPTSLVICISRAEAEKHAEMLNTMTHDVLREKKLIEDDRDRALKLVYPELSGFARPIEAYEHANGKHTRERSKDCRVCQGIIRREHLQQMLNVARGLLKKLEWALPNDHIVPSSKQTPWLKPDDVPRTLRVMTLTQGEIRQLRTVCSEAKGAHLGSEKVTELLEAVLDDIEVMRTSQHEDAIQACAKHATQLIEKFLTP